MTFPSDSTTPPQDGSTVQQPAAPEGIQLPEQYAHEQAQPGYGAGYEPPAYQPMAPGPGYQPYATPPAGDGLGIAALILAFVFWPVGLVLGIIAVVKNRGKGLGIAAIIVSVLALISTIVLIVLAVRVADNALNGTGAKHPVATAPGGTTTNPPVIGSVDPACAGAEQILISSQSELQGNQTDPVAFAKSLDDIVTQLKAQQAKSTNPAVNAGIAALIDDYTELGNDLKNNKAPDGDFLSKMMQDGIQLTTACS